MKFEFDFCSEKWN